MSGVLKNLNISKIKEILPNRYPFLMVDYALEVLPGERAVAYKNLTANEWYFPVHFPEEPMMPGMIQMEALLQTLSLTVLTLDDYKGAYVEGISANNIRLKKKVVPGKKMLMEASLISFENNIASGTVKGSIDEEDVCYGDFVFRVIKKE